MPYQPRNPAPRGRLFGEWCVIRTDAEKSEETGQHYVVARCGCGTTRTVRLSSLTGKRSSDCGCGRKRTIAQPRTHGYAARGGWANGIYRVWRNAIESSKASKVPFHKPWRQFEVFLRAVGDTPEKGARLCRIEKTKGWVPGNLEWRA